uniref:HSF-type DNA-binding domain-containing protein n=1 Tax=Pseudo-nitzschia australis TaxID=44445 RepID=A0A7S4ATW8_9STRA
MSTTMGSNVADVSANPAPSLDAAGNGVDPDKINTDNAAPITVDAMKEKLSVANDGVPSSSSAMETKHPTTAMDTAKSLNESNNKIIKELDDEAAKTFPQILMEILTNDEDSDTIAWLPHGRSFIIYKKKKFAAQVLVKYFKATKFTSFTRKLNRWGFTRVTRGTEMGSYFHKMFLRDNPELCLRMSSHTSSKYHHSQHPHEASNSIQNSPHMHGHVMMNPGGVPGFVPPGALGMPVVPFPFYGMPGMAPGAARAPLVSPPSGLPVTTPVQANMPTPPTTAAEFSQQNQYINQQLQHLQWQQFQLQQYQHQQIQAATAAAANNSNSYGAPYQQPAPVAPSSPDGSPYPHQQLQSQVPSGPPGSTPPPPLNAPDTPRAGQHPPSTDQGENRQHSSPTPPIPVQQQQQQQVTPLMPPSPQDGAHPAQQHRHYQNQQMHPDAAQQPPTHHPYGHNTQYQYGQHQSHLPHGPTHSHQGVSSGSIPPPIHHGGHFAGQQPPQAQLHPYPYQYPQQQPYHHHNLQQQQQQDYSPAIHLQKTTGPGQQQQSEMAPLTPPLQSSAQVPTPEAADEIVDPLDQGEETNDSAIAVVDDVNDKGDEDIGV